MRAGIVPYSPDSLSTKFADKNGIDVESAIDFRNVYPAAKSYPPTFTASYPIVSYPSIIAFALYFDASRFCFIIKFDSNKTSPAKDQ